MTKALIFRELKISTKSYLASLLLIVAMSAMMFLALYVMISKDLGSGETLKGFSLIMAYTFAIIIGGTIASDDTVLKSDIGSGWQRYSLALPLTAHDKAKAKYITKAIVIAVCGVLVSLICIPVFIIGKTSYCLAPIYLYICFVDILLVYDIIRQSVLMRATDLKSLKKLGIIVGAVLVGIVIALEYAFTSVSELGRKIEKVMTEVETADSPTVLNKYTSYITIPAYVGIIALVLMFVILFASYLITRKNYERRED